MKRKTAIKQLMSLGQSRNQANRYLDLIHLWSTLSNDGAVDFYRIFGNRWFYALWSVAADQLEEVTNGDGEQ